MAVFEYKNGNYGYCFLYKKERHCHTFKGLSKDQVATKEMEHKLALKKNLPYVATPEIYTWEDAVKDFKIYAKSHGNIYVIDDSNGNLRSVQSFTAIIDAIAEKEGRKVDLVVVDNADELTSFEDGGKSDADMTMVNKMINQLNAYTTTHFNGQGTMILFLAQLNRTGITELAKDKPDLNFTHISTYSNLYTKAGVVAAISINKTKDTVIDLRILKNRHGKKTGNEEPKHIAALFEYSYIEGDNLNVEVTSEEETEDDIDDIAASMNTGMQDIDDISLEDDWDDDLTVG